jgi:hypothetical protein
MVPVSSKGVFTEKDKPVGAAGAADAIDDVVVDDNRC